MISDYWLVENWWRLNWIALLFVALTYLAQLLIRCQFDEASIMQKLIINRDYKRNLSGRDLRSAIAYARGT